MVSEGQLKALESSVALDEPPYCSGVLTPPHHHDFHLYYGLGKPTFIDLASASTEGLTALTEACDPATFGLGGEDVLDETYRKAAKLDPSKFAIAFDPARCGLTKAIKGQLLQGKVATVSLDCELSRLNVYGKGAFFKPHKDTPRSKNMVGSLVVVFPTPHSGGELVLRHGKNEWTFDGASLISSQPSPSIAYIAFYGDIEHEVLKVTSGHRVTITYNLYQLSSEMVGAQESSPPIVYDVAGLTNLKRTLETILQDRTFMPKGGILGFGLRYQYPVNYETEMNDLKDRLKGSDAQIWNACSSLGLEPKLWIAYGTSDVGVALGRVRLLAEKYYKPDTGRYDERFLADMTYDHGYKVNVVNGVEAREEQIHGCWIHENEQTMQVVWVTPLAPASTLEHPILVYGNEAQLEFIYCDPCLLATVKPASERGCGMDVAEETTD